MIDRILQQTNIELPLAFKKAIVIHANKYSEAHGGAFNFPVSSTLYTDIVFRLKDTGEDCKIYVRNLDLPIYRDQEVTLVFSNNLILAYIDVQSNYYYYTTKDFSYIFGYGLPSVWIWVIGILGAIGIIIINDQTFSAWVFAPALAAYFFSRAQKAVFNYRIRKSVDKFLR